MELIVSAFSKAVEDPKAMIATRESIASNNERLMSALTGLQESMPQLGEQIQELEVLLSPCHNTDCAERAGVAAAFAQRAQTRHSQVENYLTSLNNSISSRSNEDTGHQADVAERMLQDIQSLLSQAIERVRHIETMGVEAVPVDPNQSGPQ